jgi:hypothetical protein
MDIRTKIEKMFDSVWNYNTKTDESLKFGLEINGPHGVKYHKPHRIEVNLHDDINVIKNSFKNKKNQKSLIKNGFVTIDKGNSKINDILYSINSDGFRSDDFSLEEEGILTLGCSDTYGSFQFEDKTWPRIVSKKLRLSCYNLGYGGASMNLVYLLFKKYINHVNVKNVFLLTPCPCRRSLFNPYLTTILPSYVSKSHFMYKYFIEFCSNQLNLLLDYNMMVDAVKWECHKRNINLFVIDNPSYYNVNNSIYHPDDYDYDWAGDMLHRGKIYQTKVAHKFIEMYDESFRSTRDETQSSFS